MRHTDKSCVALAVTSALCLPLLAPAATPLQTPMRPALLLAQEVALDEIDVTGYFVSEKYDGIRTYWTGHELLTRSGRRIHAPDWFVRGWPTQPLDGELWIGRQRFEELAATVRDTVPDESAWRAVRFMAFDLPSHAAPFSERLQMLANLLAAARAPTLELVPQWRAADREALRRDLDRIVAAGGEGLVLHRADSWYVAGRSYDLIKLKPYRDAEAQVIAHHRGTGKYADVLGALEVRTPEGKVFRIGTGFTDAERMHPPAIGTWITYRYHGLTANGIPRFASFMRVRGNRADDDDESHSEQDE
jgi:DNA ligase-1